MKPAVRISHGLSVLIIVLIPRLILAAAVPAALARELLGVELALVLVLLGAVLIAQVVRLAVAFERALVLALARLVQALASELALGQG